MATLFEPSHSLSRQTMTPAGPSTADQLPSINFGFEDLRDRMAKFTVRFDAFIEQGRKRVLEERNQFRINVAELQEDQRMKKKDIEILQLKTNSHQHTIAKEAAETREMQTAIASLASQRDKQASHAAALRTQISEAEREIAAVAEARAKAAAAERAQARFNVPELDFWVSTLALRIEGAGQDDRLKFVYTHVDEKDWEKECWFELDTSGREYDVKHCRPKLERESVERVLDKVNETRELIWLLKGMRELFVEVLKA